MVCLPFVYFLARWPIFTPSDVKQIRIKDFSISNSLLIQAARDKDLRAEFLPERVIKISNGNVSHYFKGTCLPCNNAVAARMSRNKYFLRQLLVTDHLPTPRTLVLKDPSDWSTIDAGNLQYPLVVKPNNASHANGASLHLTSPAAVPTAIGHAFAYNKRNKKENRVLIEEYFTGHDLRLLVVGDRVVSVVQREPAYVIGDGHSTIRQLIDAFNQDWHSDRRYDLPLCPIPLDRELSRFLADRQLTMASILLTGQKSHLRWNANVSTGGRASDVTDLVHPRLNELAVRIARLSHLEICGVDILCKNLGSADITSTNITILEVNAFPGFDIHHFPVSGRSRDVAAAIIDHIFDDSAALPNLEPDRAAKLLTDLKVSVPTPHLPVKAN